jgi:hypothetical protein
MLDLPATSASMVGNRGIEPRTRKGAGFTGPLSHQTWRYPELVAGVRFERTFRGYEPRLGLVTAPVIPRNVAEAPRRRRRYIHARRESVADGVGFEPTVVLPTSVFKTAALSQTRPPIRIGHHDRTRTQIFLRFRKPLLIQLSYVVMVGSRRNGRRIISRARHLSRENPARPRAGSSAGNAAEPPLAGVWWARTASAGV